MSTPNSNMLVNALLNGQSDTATLAFDRLMAQKAKDSITTLTTRITRTISEGTK